MNHHHTPDNFHPNKQGKALHVGLIPDGGRRWARKNNVSLSKSYAVSRDLGISIAKYLFSLGVSELSVYLSSSQNFSRSDSEIASFTSAAAKSLENEILDLARLLNLRVVIVGNNKSISSKVVDLLMRHNKQLDSRYVRRLNLCISYNPTEELENAISLSKSSGIFLEYLWVTKPVDLIIRSGGANLISNFLPLQSGFARLYFLDELFNDVPLSSIKNIMNSFLELNRKFGD